MHPSILKCKTCSTYDLLWEWSINHLPSVSLLLWIFTIFVLFLILLLVCFVRRIINAV